MAVWKSEPIAMSFCYSFLFSQENSVDVDYIKSPRIRNISKTIFGRDGFARENLFEKIDKKISAI